MKPTRMRVMAVAALSTVAIAAPVSTAVADTPTPAVAVTVPGAGRPATVIGPTFVTTAPTTFINTNTQVASGDISSGSQSTP
jgi:hypothetical protein